MLVLKYYKTNEEFSSESQAADTYTGIEISADPKSQNYGQCLKSTGQHSIKSPALFQVCLTSFVTHPYDAYQKRMMT